MTEATDIDHRFEHTDEATSVNETGNISTQAEPDPIAHITNADIDRACATQREERAAPISKLGTFRGYESFRSFLLSIQRVGQQDKGKKTNTGRTYIGNDREAACELLDIPFEYEQTDYDDYDPHVLEAATDSNAERRRETQGQAICTAVRTRMFHEEIQKQRPLHQLPTYERLARKFVGSERSHRSVRNARKVLDLCPDPFACVEAGYVSVAGSPFHRNGRLVRYVPAELDAWAESRMVTSTTEAR